MEYEHKDKNNSFLNISRNKENQIELYIQNEDKYLFHYLEVNDIEEFIKKLQEVKSEIIKENNENRTNNTSTSTRISRCYP